MNLHNKLSRLLLPILVLWMPVALGAKVNLGLIDPAEMAKTYPDFE